MFGLFWGIAQHPICQTSMTNGVLCKDRGSFLPDGDLVYYRSSIPVDTNRLLCDLLRANGLPLVDTGVDRIWVLGRHLPEGVLDDDRGIGAFLKDLIQLFAADVFDLPPQGDRELVLGGRQSDVPLLHELGIECLALGGERKYTPCSS